MTFCILALVFRALMGALAAVAVTYVVLTVLLYGRLGFEFDWYVVQSIFDGRIWR